MPSQRIRIPDDVLKGLEAKAAAVGRDLQSYLRAVALGDTSLDEAAPLRGEKRIEDLEARVAALEAKASGVPGSVEEDFDDLDEIL